MVLMESFPLGPFLLFRLFLKRFLSHHPCAVMDPSEKPAYCFDPSPEESLRQHRELQILFGISSALHASPHLRELLQRALNAISLNVKVSLGAIYLVKEIQDNEWLLELEAHHGFSSALANSIKFLSAPSVVMDNYYHEDQVRWFPVERVVFSKLREKMRRSGIEEIVCIALMAAKKVLGLLYMTNDGVLQLKPERREFLITIGQQLGVSIENAKLFQSVERAKSELEISFDAIGHSIFLVDTRMRIHRVNRTSEMVYGSAEKLIGEKYTRILYGMSQPPSECPIWACLWGAQPAQREGPHPRWGGYYHFFAFPVVNSTGSLERVIYYEKDATEAKKLEQRLQQSDRLKALGTLAAGIAHEIRNPLATINFNTQLLSRELKLDPAQRQMFEDVATEVRKIDRIVQQVLHFARPKEPQFLPHRLNDIVSYCLDLSKIHLRKGNVDVLMDLGEGIPLVVMDFNQISQVIMNLLLNAIEAMPDGGTVEILTRFQKEASMVLLEVSDKGPGIMVEDLERVFDPFFTRKPEGTGLGLSISRQILDNHGAYIEVDSSPGEGSTFRIIFPVYS